MTEQTLTRLRSVLCRAGIAETGALLLLSPLIVSLSPRVPGWDELHFLHRGACVRNAVHDASLAMVDRCLSEMGKSPIMALLMLPSWSPRALSGPTIGPMVLALLSFGLLWAGLRAARRAGMAPAVMLATAATTALAPPLATGAPYMVDGLLSIIILDTLLLIPLEAAAPVAAPSDALRRGGWWGLIACLGLMSKLTYLYFALAAFGAALLLSLWRSGIRMTALKLAVMGGIVLLPAALFARYAPTYWQHAMGSAFGPVAQFYDDHIARWAFMRTALRSMGIGWWAGLAALLVYALLGWRRGVPARSAILGLVMAVIVVGYLFIASGSPNKDPRFFWPVWLALPFCVAVAANGSASPPRPRGAMHLDPIESSTRSPAGSTRGSISLRAKMGRRVKPGDDTREGVNTIRTRDRALWPALLALLLTLLAAGRFDMRLVFDGDTVLRGLPRDRPVTVLVASDEAGFNVDTLRLARQLDLPAYRPITIDTVVYDVVAGLTVDDSIRRLLHADYVVLRDPVDGTAPEWATRFLPQFRAAVQANGKLILALPGAQQLQVYEMQAARQ